MTSVTDSTAKQRLKSHSRLIGHSFWRQCSQTGLDCAVIYVPANTV